MSKANYVKIDPLTNLKKLDEILPKWGDLEGVEKTRHLKAILQREVDDESEVEMDVMSEEFKDEIINVWLEPILSAVEDSVLESKKCIKF